MADFPNSTPLPSITRRSVLAGLAVSAALAPAAAKAVDDVSYWTDIYGRWRAADIAMADSAEALDDAMTSSRKDYPAQRIEFSHATYVVHQGEMKPRWRDGLGAFQRYPQRSINLEYIRKHYDQALQWQSSDGEFRAEGRRRMAITVASFEEWQGKVEAVNDRYKLKGLQDADKAATFVFRELEKLIVQAPTSSMSGIAVKLALACDVGLDPDDEDASSTDRALFAARDSAFRLSGLAKLS